MVENSEELNFCETVTIDVDDVEKKQLYSDPIKSFNDTKLSTRFYEVSTLLKLVNPTPVQEWSWYPLINNEEVITKAETGSGKTLSFLLPTMEKIFQKQRHTFDSLINKDYCVPDALILTPTRELAQQIYNLCLKIQKIFNINSSLVTGGVGKDNQLKSLLESKCNILIATPGRLVDLLENKKVNCDSIHTIIFDEADKMLDMGFKDQLQTIYTYLYPIDTEEEKKKKNIQCLLFSATYQENIKELTSRWMTSKSPILISISPPSLLSSRNTEISICNNIIQDYVLEEDKKNGKRQRSLICIFVNTIRNAREVYQFIHDKWDEGNPYLKHKEQNTTESKRPPKPLNVAILHGQLSQEIRTILLQKFRSGAIQILVTTDVLGRGMDIPNLNYVLNYDFPSNLGTYVHRIGRTGRKGIVGYSRSFLTGRFFALVPDLELLLKASNQKIPPILHQVAEEQRILREFQSWEENKMAMKEDENEEKEETDHSNDIHSMPISDKQQETIKPKPTLKRSFPSDSNNYNSRPKKIPLKPIKKNKK
ncbi:hypothetical protein WA158_005046 [Blastocystis sp. Blastoise]